VDATHERADLLFRLSLTLFEAGALEQGEALGQARAALAVIGDRARAAVADSLLGTVWWVRGDRDRGFEHLARASELVRDAPPSAEKAQVLSQLVRYQMLAREFDEEAAREALQLAESLGLDEIRAQLVTTIGTARDYSGHPEGRLDIERGLAIALAGNWLEATIRGYTNLASGFEYAGNLREALRVTLKVEEVALRLGGPVRRRWVEGNLISLWLDLGEWEKCAQGADEFLAESERIGPHYPDASVHGARAVMRFARD